MVEMTASEASRSFSSLLDRAEDGETVVITRAGRRVAVISPAPAATGRSLIEVLERWRGHPALDDSFAERVTSARSVALPELDTDPWREPEG